MAQYIDKDAIMAEIGRRLRSLANKNAKAKGKYDVKICTLVSIKTFINTLEVKEVDLEKEIETQWNKFVDSEGEIEQFSEIAKHFIEFGLKLQSKI